MILKNPSISNTDKRESEPKWAKIDEKDFFGPISPQLSLFYLVAENGRNSW